MSLRSKIASFSGNATRVTARSILKKGGTSLPGKIAYKIDPTVLKELKGDLEVILITGTNGKTLTTALTARVLKEAGRTIITNPSGSNMMQGIISTLLANKKRIKRGIKPIAVLEVDEANVEAIAKLLQPSYIVMTNIFRDQMDRFGEIYTTYKKITDGIKVAPNSKVIANGDSPIFSRIDFTNEITYFGFNHKRTNKIIKAPNNTDGILSPNDDSVLRYHFITYANLGNFFDDGGFKRPKLDYSVNKVTKLTPTFSDFEIDNNKIHLPIGGLYNIYNALTAYSVGRSFDLEPAIISNSLNADSKIFGRQEVLDVFGKKVTIVLIKNPVGANSVIDMIATDDKEFSLITLLNANYADGIDTSWIFDAEFEKLHNTKIKKVIVGGHRYKDISVRLKFANFEDQEIVSEVKDIPNAIKKLKTKNVYIAATYTAMLELRRELAKQGFVEESF